MLRLLPFMFLSNPSALIRDERLVQSTMGRLSFVAEDIVLGIGPEGTSGNPSALSSE
jgi:hypothetical protein